MKSLFYLCKNGAVKAKAEEYRTAYISLREKLFDAAKAAGIKNIAICDTMMLIRGAVFQGDVPKGWTKPNRVKLSRPLRTKANVEIRKLFTPDGSYMVKRHPALQAFFDWLQCPCGYQYTQGEHCTGSTRIGNLFDPVSLHWYAEKGPILLITPDVAAEKKLAEQRGYQVKNNALDWTPPKGLRQILREEWDLMQAKYKNKQEAVGIMGNSCQGEE